MFIDGVDTTFARYGGTPHVPAHHRHHRDHHGDGRLGRRLRARASARTNVIVKSAPTTSTAKRTGVYTDLEWDSNYDAHQEFEEHPTRPASGGLPRAHRRRAQTSTNPTTRPSFGGPIVRDKAWFFVAASEFGTFTRDKTVSGDLIDQSTDSESYIAKLNFQPAAAHSLAGSWIDTPITRLFQLDDFADQYVPTMHDIGG